MNPDVRKEKLKRFVTAAQKLAELRKAEPAGDFLAHQRATANFLTTTFGISRPLSDRYVAEAVLILDKLNDTPVESLFGDAAFAKVTDLDDKFGLQLMVDPKHVECILDGAKHMSRRFRRWGDEGDTFKVKGQTFRFIRINQLRVGDITDDDIRKEGYSTREEFEQMWYKNHPKSVAAGKKLNPDEWCWCHEYEPV
jgi:hypothetical protein